MYSNISVVWLCVFGKQFGLGLEVQSQCCLAGRQQPLAMGSPLPSFPGADLRGSARSLSIRSPYVQYLVLLLCISHGGESIADFSRIVILVSKVVLNA